MSIYLKDKNVQFMKNTCNMDHDEMSTTEKNHNTNPHSTPSRLFPLVKLNKLFGKIGK